MIRTFVLTGALAAALAASGAVAQPLAPRGPMHPAMAPSGPGAAMATPDYIHAAATTDEYEIAAARMALKHSHNSHVRAFATRMIHDHTQSTAMIKAAIRKSGHPVPPPPAMTSEQQHMLDDLRTAGPNFDRTYVNQQVQVHQMALGVHQGYADGGSDPALRHAASQIVPVVKMHLRMAQDMQSHMG